MQPRIILMDEPSMGLAPILVDSIFAVIKCLNQAGTMILMVEQNARMALEVAHRGYVLETGRVVLAGMAAGFANDPKGQAANLGDHEQGGAEPG